MAAQIIVVLFDYQNKIRINLWKFLLKVRNLESKNKLLEAEIDALKSRHVKPSGLRQLYESQLKDLKRVAEQMRVQKVRRGSHFINRKCKICFKMVLHFPFDEF